ncbi:FimV domain-containing protein [Acinetobacter gyllenbergii]|uniref:FimV domain-containing protein n=1 Tax=Acinetobacter gyllenbergii TaxID=134534 RepID=UPI0021D217D1|nr:FimV domain-containing protein [Acinetobacter gyllenbergii]MCU4580555.1 FimV domain-containing protein [Acinetobacter gyllenbergii]
MSTIIIVLLVIVLIVAIVLKKRESNQANAAPKKGASKTAKKAATRSASRTTLVREEQEYAPPTTTEISESLRQKLEQQIQNGNFQSAEAQINQALKQDNAQHELYLYLLDIHLKQKDDLAIDQLIKHIHALKLEDIAQAAEAKHREYEQNKQPDSIDFNLASHHFQQPSAAAEPQIQNNVADFDALVQAPAAQSFDDLQSEYAAPAEETKPVEAAPEIQPLDFNFSFEQKPTPEAAPAPVEVPESKEQPPLEFSFNLEPTTPPSIEEAKVEEAKPALDFNFANLEVASQPIEEKAPVEETAPSLDFNFEPTVAKTEQPTSLETAAFSFDVAEPAAVETPPELIAPVTAPSATIAIHDPLVQSFPDLQQLDEAQLNLELAEQYIELGAYDSARELLKNNQAFNAEQQQRSENLLNKIAS